MHLLTLSGLVTSAVATQLYVSSYAGTVTSVTLNKGANAYSISAGAVNTGCGAQASWLTKDSYNSVIYCVDEAFSTPNGSVSSFKTSASGVLTQIDKHDTFVGPVSTVVFNGGKSLAAAH